LDVPRFVTFDADAHMSTDVFMNTATYTPQDDALVFTDAAAIKVRELIEQEHNDNLKLRVYVSGGGCSGFQYGFTFDEDTDEDDTRISKQGVTLLVDPMSALYLSGAEIDFSDGVEGAQFIIRNPNATTTCGCGNSFAV